MTDRITELEIKLSLTEDMVEELNRTVFRQQEQLDLLQAQLRHVYGQMKASAEAAEAITPFSLRDEINVTRGVEQSQLQIFPKIGRAHV